MNTLSDYVFWKDGGIYVSDVFNGEFAPDIISFVCGELSLDKVV